MTKRVEIPLFILAALLVLVIFVLIITGHLVPIYLYAILGAVLTGGLGLAVPSSTSPEIPAEVSALIGDLRKIFGALTEPAPTVAPPPAPGPAPTTGTMATAPAEPAPAFLTTVPPAPQS
jgi:hypothetical protein